MSLWSLCQGGADILMYCTTLQVFRTQARQAYKFQRPPLRNLFGTVRRKYICFKNRDTSYLECDLSWDKSIYLQHTEVSLLRNFSVLWDKFFFLQKSLYSLFGTSCRLLKSKSQFLSTYLRVPPNEIFGTVRQTFLLTKIVVYSPLGIFI